MVLGLSAAAGMFVAGMCAMFYAKGVRDGMDVKRGKKPRAFTMGRNEEAPVQSEMGRKFETILSYDPYSKAVRGEADEGGAK